MPVFYATTQRKDQRLAFVALRHLRDWETAFHGENVIDTCSSYDSAVAAIDCDVAERLEKCVRMAAAILWTLRHPLSLLGQKLEETHALELARQLVDELTDLRSLCGPFGHAVVVEKPTSRGGILLALDGEVVNPKDWDMSRLILRRRFLDAESGMVGGVS